MTMVTVLSVGSVYGATMAFGTTVQFRVKFIPLTLILSEPEVIAPHEVDLNSSNLSWAYVAASVIRPPKELFLVVWIIKPANPKKAMDKMTKAIKISISEKPFDFIDLIIDPA